jgi:hypothetical protein
MASLRSFGGRPATGNKLKPKAKVKAKGKTKKPAVVEADPFNTPLTPETLAQQVAAQAGLAYGGQEQEISGQRAVSAQMQRNIPAWYQDYQNALAMATQQRQGAYAGAQAAQANTAASSSALDAQQRAQTGQAMQADAATRGATVDPALAVQSQQAAASRRGTLDQMSSLTAATGAAEVAYGANRQVVGAGQKLSAQLGEAQRGRNIDTAAQELAGEKGQYATSTRQKLIDSEHTKQLENKAFGLNVEKAKADVQIKTASLANQRAARVTSNRNADQSRGISAQRAAETARHNRTQEQTAAARLAKTKAGGLTPAQRAARAKEALKTKGQIDTAAADVKTLRGTAVPVTTPDGKVEVGKDGKPTQRTRKLTESEIRAGIRKKYKDRDIANAAMDLAINGYVSPVNQRRLKARGLKVPKEWLSALPTVKAKPRPNP